MSNIFSDSVKKKLIYIGIAVAFLIGFAAAYIIFMLAVNSNSDLQKEISIQIEEQKKIIDSLRDDRGRLEDDLRFTESQIQKLQEDRSVIDQEISFLRNQVKDVKRGYENINNRYNNLSADSIQRIFSTRFR